METQLDNNNPDDNDTESTSRQLGAAFLVVGWIAAIALVAMLLNHAVFGTKKPSISETDAGKQITITRDSDSHFRIKGSINGIPVTFLIDTGATSVAVSTELASKAHLTKQAELTAETASGNSMGYFTMIDTLNIGGVDVHNISAVIIPDYPSNQALLGMNVLSKFIIQQQDNIMVLTVPAEDKPSNYKPHVPSTTHIAP